MICLVCKNYAGLADEPYCRGCGTKTFDHRCECGNKFLNYSQKFCQLCGKAVPPKPELEEIANA